MLMPLPKRRIVPKREAHPVDGPSTKRSRGRPMKKASELQLPLKIRRRGEELLHQQLSSDIANEKKSPRLSLLESLPVELIQHIFFNALEMNLPRSSPQLASALSMPSVYSSLVLFAYFDDDDETRVETQMFLPAEYRELGVEDKTRLQAGILACNWCTVDFLKSCMPKLSRLQMVQAWHRESRAESEVDMPDRLSATTTLQSLAALPQSVSELGLMERHFHAKFEPPQDGDLASTGFDFDVKNHSTPHGKRMIGPTGQQNFLPRIIEWKHVTDRKKRLQKTLHYRQSVLGTRVISDYILQGKPFWTDEKLELLMLLRQGARFVTRDNELTVSPAALFEGMASAIVSQNSWALLVLLELHWATMRTSSQSDLGHDRPGSELVGPFTHPIPLSLFHLASAQPYPSSAELMALLLREGIESIPVDDDVLTAWAVRENSDGDGPAHFLLKHMEGANNYGPARLSLFSNGGIQPWEGRSGLGFQQTTFTEEIGYIDNP